MKQIAILILTLLSFTQLQAQVKRGTASFYAQKFEGRRCASGERFCNDSLTCAHHTLPFGTLIKVCSPSNKCVIVKVNDRLSRKSKRSIDLSQRAAKQIGLTYAGLMKVSYEVVGSGSIVLAKRTYKATPVKKKKKKKKVVAKKKKVVHKKKTTHKKKPVAKKKPNQKKK